MSAEKKWSRQIMEELKFEEGIVLVKDDRFFLGHKYMLEFMHSTLKAIMGPATKTILYQYGEMVGYHLMKHASDRWRLREEELADFIFNALALWGFGKFNGVVYDRERKFLKAVVQDSVEAFSIGKAEKPSCYVIAGICGGIGKFLFRGDVICREKICEAAGDASCEFEVEPYFK